MPCYKCFLLAIVIYCSAVTLASSQERYMTGGRLFQLAKSTSTVVSYMTTWSVCQITTSCAITVGTMTRCRRIPQIHRGFVEEDFLLDVDDIFPSKPERVEVTAAPVVSVEVDEPKHHSVPELFSASSSSWTTSDDKEPRQVLINGLSGDCRMQPAGSDGQQEPFGVTLIHTVTLTSDFTCASFNTRTNTYTLSGCTPLGLSFCP